MASISDGDVELLEAVAFIVLSEYTPQRQPSQEDFVRTRTIMSNHSHETLHICNAPSARKAPPIHPRS